MKDLINRLSAAQIKYSLKADRVDELEGLIKDCREDLKEYTSLLDLLNNRVYGCKLLVEKLVAISKTNLEQFLTFALNKIFIDRNYEIKLEFKEDSKRPGLELVLVEDGQAQEITDSVGGGILSTLGLLLQIYYIEVYGLTKYMFIDEGLKEISKASITDEDSVDYLEQLLDFLKWLSVERNYTFVIVTHDTSVITQADKVYTIKNGTVVY